jgi:hypothetical protein
MSLEKQKRSKSFAFKFLHNFSIYIHNLFPLIDTSQITRQKYSLESISISKIPQFHFETPQMHNIYLVDKSHKKICKQPSTHTKLSTSNVYPKLEF